MFDFGAALRVLKRSSGLIAVITALCLVGGLLIDAFKTDRYVAGTTVLLEAPSLNPFGREQVYQGTKFDNVTIESQMQVIRSPLLLSQVVEDLQLDRREAFWTPRQGQLATLLGGGVTSLKIGLAGMLRDGIDPGQELTDFAALKTRVADRLDGAAAPEPTAAERFQSAVKKLREDVSVSRNGVTSVLNIKVTANTPALSADIANAISQAYVMRRYDLRRSSAEEAAGWFEKRMEELGQQAVAAEEQLSTLGSAGAAAAPTGGVQADALATLRAAISARLDAQTRFDQIELAARSSSPLDVLPARLESDALATLADQYAATSDVTTRAALNEQALALMPGLRAEAQATLGAAQQAENAARMTVSQGGGAGGAANGASTANLRTLESEARIYREMYENYTTTYLRTKEQQTFPAVDASVLVVAQPPEGASGPGGMKIMMIAALLGLTLGGGTAFVNEARDPVLRTRAGLAKSVGAPVLGLLPKAEEATKAAPGKGPQMALPDTRTPQSRAQQNRAQVKKGGTTVITLPQHRLALERLDGAMSLTLTDPLSKYSDTIRRIRVAFENYFAPHGGKRAPVIGFMSDGGTKTRSTAALNYAEMVAVGGKRTLMIDFDWLEAFLSRTITPSAEFGVPDLMLSGENFRPEEAFWLDERSGLYFLPNRGMGTREVVDPAVFDTNRLIALIDSLSLTFEQIVIDFSSLSTSVDAAALTSVVDGYVCTAEWGMSDQRALAKTIAACGVPPEKMVGAVMGGVSEEELSRYEATV